MVVAGVSVVVAEVVAVASVVVAEVVVAVVLPFSLNCFQPYF